jgi:hypothetical protein
VNWLKMKVYSENRPLGAASGEIGQWTCMFDGDQSGLHVQRIVKKSQANLRAQSAAVSRWPGKGLRNSR